MADRDCGFTYEAAFSRNIGWLTDAEQAKLRTTRVAIAGLGGVGGAHLLALTRLGIGRFRVADFDDFGVHNFNRQAGAFMSTVGLAKADVLERMALDINPTLDLDVFRDGVTDANLARFLDGVDVYVDGIDFFALDARIAVFEACRARGIPAVTAAPLGMGCGLLYFAPDGMPFDEYFRFKGSSRQEQYVRFIAGLSPAMLQRNYLVQPAAVNFGERRGPSTIIACELCAGLTASAVLKIVLRRGALRPAPWAIQFDAYKHQLVHTWRPFGNANPLQRLLMLLIRHKLNLAPEHDEPRS
jgi:molybdopterin/thiamine biosynthesis adenylyltransferase